MPKRNTGRRGRPRKRRPPASGTAASPSPAAADDGGAAKAASSAGPAKSRHGRGGRSAAHSDRSGGLLASQPLGERPEAPWHPLPLSELLILIGVVGVIVAWLRGFEGSGALIAVSILAVAIGTIEGSLREHLAGYRSHAVMLAVLPPVILHTLVIVGVSLFTPVPRWLYVALLPVDVVVFVISLRWLRARFRAARQRRTLALGR